MKINKLTDLLKSGSIIVWTKELAEKIDSLVKEINEEPRLHYPNYVLPFALEVEASNEGIGSVLYQPGKI